MNRWLLLVLVAIFFALVSIARDVHHATLVAAAYGPTLVKTTGGIPLSEDEKRILDLDSPPHGITARPAGSPN